VLVFVGNVSFMKFLVEIGADAKRQELQVIGAGGSVPGDAVHVDNDDDDKYTHYNTLISDEGSKFYDFTKTCTEEG